MFKQGATPPKATCSTHIWTEEEDVAEEEADSAKDEADEVQPLETTPNFGKKTESWEECAEEGEVYMPVQADKTSLNADIAVKSSTKKKSARRRSVNRLPQADNSRITPPTPTTKTLAECSWWDIEFRPLLRLMPPF